MYTVKEAARISNLSEHTIRFYTDKGLIPSIQRDKNNNRLFDDRSLKWLIGIKRLKDCGMSINDIKHYVDLCLQGDSTIQERYEIVLKQRDKANAILEEAKQIAEYMERKVRHYHDIATGVREDDTNPAKWILEENLE